MSSGPLLRKQARARTNKVRLKDLRAVGSVWSSVCSQRVSLGVSGFVRGGGCFLLKNERFGDFNPAEVFAWTQGLIDVCLERDLVT